MAGLNKNFYKGNLSELLADYLLSFIGVVVPVRRQFDIGIDFYCALINNESSDYLTFDNPFTIQIKSFSKRKVEFGNSNSEKWRSEHIGHLFKNEIPFFIGIVNKKTNSLCIYDTSGLWQLYRNTERNCSRIMLRPDAKEKYEWRENHSKKQIPNWNNFLADGFEYTIDMGTPIIDLNEKDLHDKKVLQQKRETLREVINIERENIMRRNLGVNCFKEIKRNRKNEKQGLEWGMEIRSFEKPQIDKLYNSMRTPLISLLVNLGKENVNEIAAIKTILKFLPKEDYYRQLYDNNPEFFEWLSEEKNDET